MIKLLKKGFLIILLFSFNCNTEEKTLPILSFKINDQGVKEYYTITYNEFVNQFNQPFSTNNIKGKVYIANFFFTRCPSICPPMQQELVNIHKAIKNHEDFKIISHTIDMTNDSVSVLYNYWKTTTNSAKNWQFLVSSETNTKTQAKQYMTNFIPNESFTDFYHSSYVTLVDKKQQIRGFYNSLNPNDMEQLIEDINILAK